MKRNVRPFLAYFLGFSVLAVAVSAVGIVGAQCTPPPAGIVGWWKGDGSAADTVAGNNGVLVNAAYTNGLGGLAFSFDPELWPYGTYTGVQISDQPAYALTNALTIEGWIRPRGDGYVIFCRGDNRPGQDPYALGMQLNNTMLFNITDANNNTASLGTMLAYNTWTHLAATLDGSTGTMSVYTNGVLAAQTNTSIRPFGNLIAGDSPGVGIGNVNDGFNNFPFYGDIDEIALYNRALSPAEISAIYLAGSAGKCSPGSGSSCTPPPTGIVSWWRGENNASDAAGANSGTWTGGGSVNSYAAGEVNQAMQFDGTHRDRVDLGNPASLQLQNFTIEAWIKRASASVVSLDENFADGSIAGPGGYVLGCGAGGYALVVFDDGSFGLTQNSVNDTRVPPVLTDTNWHHVAVAKAGTTVTMFVDGVQQPTPSLNPYTNVFTFTTSVAIASRGDGGGNTFFGSIDELAVYNRALSSNEVTAIYHAGSAGKCPVTPLVSSTPAIFNFSPASGSNGTVVVIAGTNFSATAASNIVYFGAVRANVLAASANSLTVTVPTGATYAPITVTVGGLIAYANAPFLVTFAGSGSTALAPRLDLPAIDGPGVVAFADLDGDGKPDLLVASGNQGISIYQNISSNGTVTAGSFAPRVDLPEPAGLDAMTVADVDGDGKLDILLLNRNSSQVMILKNISTPGILTANSFAAPVAFSTGSDPRGVAVQDLDGDGKPELIVANWGDNTVSVFHNTGATGLTTNSFAPAVTFAVGANPQALAVADLDGDGRPDVVTANNNYGTDNSVSILRNTSSLGNISFAAHADLAGLATSYGIAVGDLDGDGKLDLAVSSFINGQAVSVYRNASTPGSLTTSSFAPHVDFEAGGWGNAVAIGDLDGDGKPDLAVVTQLPDHLSIFKNISVPGSFTTGSLAARVDYPAGWNPNGVAIGDLDGDGRPDIAFTVSYGATLSICQNQTPAPVTALVTNPPVITAIAPVLGTPGTSVTISGTNFSPIGASNIVYFGAVRANISSASVNSLTTTVPPGATFGPVTVTVGGLAAYSGQLFEPTFAGNGSNITTGSFAPSFTLAGASGPQSMVIADLDGDGKPDIAFVNGYSNLISIYRNISTNGELLGSASFAPRLDLTEPAANGDGPYRLHAVDLDGDGRLDLIVSDVNSDHISIFHNIAAPGNLTTDSFEAPLPLATVHDTRFSTAADLDGDGRVDIVALNYGAKTISIYKNIGTAGILNSNSFAPPVVIASPGGPYEAVIADLDGDGKPDLAAVECDNNTVSIFQNQSITGTLDTNSFAVPVDFVCGSLPQTITAVDLDGDGRLDLVTGSIYGDSVNVYRNLSTGGLLTTNSFAAEVDFGTPGWMHTVSVADFNGDGKPDLGVCGELGSYMAVFQNAATPGSFTSASFAPRVDFSTGWNAWGIACGDLDGDGRPDIVFGNYYDNTVQIYQNQVPFGALPVAPAITTQPTNIVVTISNTAAFSVTAAGTAPLFYQWAFNGTNISGATNNTLTLNDVQPWQTGNYSVTVSNSVGGIQSSNAVLTVNVPPTPPSMVAQSPNQVVLVGNTATFSVTAGGTPPLNYFWSRNGALIPDATNSVYNSPNAQLTDSGSKFSCLVTNLYGSASSTNVSLKVIDTIANDLCSGAIIITNSPYTNIQSTLKASSYGDPAPDCVDGFGHGVWYQFAAPVNGQLWVDSFGSDFDTGLAIYTGSCDSLAEAACDDDTGGVGVTSQVMLPTVAGTTYYILAGGYGSDAGNLVLHLYHLTAPAFVTQPADESVVAGSNATFSATMVGALPMAFQWNFNGNPLADDGRITGSATAYLVVSNTTTADAGSYSLTVSNFLGITNSSTAVLTVLTPPAFTQQPPGRSVPPGLPTTFTASASGIPSPGYQWQLNGTNIPGAVFASYTNAGVGSNDLGWYQVVASNSVGSVTSAVAQLTFGPVAAWGLNLSGESLPPPGLSNVVGIAGSIACSFALRTDGSVAFWGGSNGTNIPVSATNVVAVSATSIFGNYALRSDGTVVSWPAPMPAVLTNIVSIAKGGFSGLALRAEGTLVVLGTPPPFLNTPAGLNRVAAISCGYEHNLALRSDGSVIAWGILAATNVPPGLSNITAIAGGYSHSLALKANGTVVAWGSGSGTNLPAGLTNIVAISTENTVPNSLSMALRRDGKILVWGDNPNGETNMPSALNSLFSTVATAAPNHGLALVNDGSPQILQPPIGLTAYTGRDVTLKAAAVGAVPLSYQWLLNGTNVSGATNANLFLPNIQAVNAGNYQLFVSNSVSTALSLPAPVTVVTNYVLTFLSQSAGVTNFQGAKVTAGGVTVQGSGPLAYQWFFSPTNRNYTPVAGATNDTLVFDPALAVQSGYYYVAVSNGFVQLPYQSLALTSAPVVVKIYFARAWGYGAVSNPPVNVTNAIAVATGGSSANSGGLYLALSSDGKVSAWANYYTYYGETNVSALTNYFVTAIAAGYQHALAVKLDGTVAAWGYGYYGQTNVPSGLNYVVAVACGGYHDLALKSDGTVVGWGAGGTQTAQYNYGQATNNPAATNVVAIAAGNLHSLALRADGSVVAWGNYDGTSVPPTATNVIAIAAGNSSSVALRANGTVVEWGSGILNYPVPSNLSNVVAISASAYHTTALKNDGSVVSWGSGYIGTASNNVPPDVANVAAISSGGEHDFALQGKRAPIFTVQPWNRIIPLAPQVLYNPFRTNFVPAVPNVLMAGKCVGVQPVQYQWLLNGTNVPGATNDSLAMRYNGQISQIVPGVYQLVASNACGVTVSKPAKLDFIIPPGIAVDATNLNWTTSGNVQWYGQTNITHDGSAAARSGGIGPMQETILQTTLGTNVAGALSFWWKVSSEQFFDTLEFRLNGVTQTSVSGEVNWTQVSIPLPAGTNVLQWRYSKDPSFDSGLDAGFVDQVTYAVAPKIVRQPTSFTANYGDTVYESVAVTGSAPMTYQWTQNGKPIGPNWPALAFGNVSREQNGVYSVTITNLAGSVTSSNAMIRIIVPQQLGTPLLLADGSLQLMSTDAGGITLTLTAADLTNFEAQASTDLVNWVTLPGALSLTNGVLQLQDSARTNYPARYYRIIEH